MSKLYTITLLFVAFLGQLGHAQGFYFGSDLSYVNEMEDCGVIYKENNTPKDPYLIFADHGTNIVRLRLWHTPAWYDTLNAGNRYSDYEDVCRSIMRAKSAGMHVLLDFHLSDLWADPSRQIVPAAWAGVVNNLPVLQDSLYNYVKNTLTDLHSKGLLPEMVQIGNETNRGIMLSEQQNNAGWQLNWPRNAALFKRGIQAVRDVEAATGQNIKVALHIADPADASWLMSGFWSNGVKDFDVIGLSYYWAWHKPTTIQQTGTIIENLRSLYAGKEVMIFETGYIWTTQSNDNANNIISETHPNYPATPDGQLKWLIDLTQEVINSGGSGVMYWEPAWVSSTCYTPWGQGSHQEHATFFDFTSNMLPGGGMIWPEHDFQNLPSSTNTPNASLRYRWASVALGGGQHQVFLAAEGLSAHDVQFTLLDTNGRTLQTSPVFDQMNWNKRWGVRTPGTGMYFVSIRAKEGNWVVKIMNKN